jgi:hypothetical protein
MTYVCNAPLCDGVAVYIGERSVVWWSLEDEAQ